MQFALLGNVQFELITYFDGLEGRFASDYAEHALIEGKPRLQWIGERLDEWTLKLKFHQLFCDPELELARLRNAMETHEPLPFVLATGEYKGEFVIAEISAVSEQTDRQGGLVEVAATLNLKECPDPEGERSAESRSSAVAVWRADRPLPPAVKTGLLDQAKPNLASTWLKDAMVAGRDVVGAFRAASDIVSLGRQLASNPLMAVERLAYGVPSFDGLARAAGRFGVSLQPLPSTLAAARPLMTVASRVAGEARSASGALGGLTAGNLVGRLDALGGNLSNMGRHLDVAAPQLARLSARVAVREVV